MAGVMTEGRCKTRSRWDIRTSICFRSWPLKALAPKNPPWQRFMTKVEPPRPTTTNSPLSLLAGRGRLHSTNPGRRNPREKVENPFLLLERQENRSRPDGISNDPGDKGGESSVPRPYQVSRHAV